MKTTITISTDTLQKVPDGVPAQSVTISSRRLALIPSTVGAIVSVSINGHEYVNPDSITVAAGDTVTASGGICVYRVEVDHTYNADGSDCFWGKKCAVVGDSFLSIQGSGSADDYNNCTQAVKWWEMLSSQYADRDYFEKGSGTNYKCTNLATGIDCYNGKNMAGTLYALGGTGHYRSNPYYQRLEGLHHDADIVIIYGSINDYVWRTSSQKGTQYWPNETYGEVRGVFNYNVGCYFSNCNMQNYAETLLWAIPNSRDMDTDELAYYSQYVVRAILTAHKNAPLAKVVIVNSFSYAADGGTRDSKNILDTYFVRYVMVQYILKTVDGADKWLVYYDELLDITGTTYDSATGKYTKVLGDYMYGPVKVPDWDGSGEMVEFGFYPKENSEAFRLKYLSDYPPTRSSFGHPNTLANEVYFAPVFAHMICDLLGVQYSALPEGLKYENDTSGDIPDDPPQIDWKPTGMAINARGCLVMSGVTSSGDVVYSGVTASGIVVQFRTRDQEIEYISVDANGYVLVDADGYIITTAQ